MDGQSYRVEENCGIPLVEQSIERLQQLILDRDLKENEKLPNEYELAQLLNVGRSTVREAVKALAVQHVVEIRRGAGTFLCARPGVSDDPFGLRFVRDKVKLAVDLMEIRFMIEPRIAALAAMQATDNQIAGLEAQCARVEELVKNGEPYAEEDIRLHTMIADCTQNQVIPNLIPIINRSIGLFMEVTQSSLRQETIEMHRSIVQAIRRHNPVAAEDAMQLHLVYYRQSVQRVLDNQGE